MFLFNHHSYLNLTLIPPTQGRRQSKQTESQQKSWFAGVLRENVPEITNDDRSSPVRAANRSETHWPNRWTSDPDPLCRSCCRGSRVQLAERIPGDCSQRLADAWSQTLDHFRFGFLSLHQPPPLTPPNNSAVSPPDYYYYYYFSDCVTLSSTEEGWREWKQEKQERLFSHRVNPCH